MKQANGKYSHEGIKDTLTQPFQEWALVAIQLCLLPLFHRIPTDGKKIPDLFAQLHPLSHTHTHTVKTLNKHSSWLNEFCLCNKLCW